MSNHPHSQPRRPLPSRADFARHLLSNSAVGVGVAFVVVSLLGGALGYHTLAGVGWLDGLLH